MSKSSYSAAHLRVDGLSKTFPDRRVFTNISFAVPQQDRIGVIGENGSGKTTLLRIIAGELSHDAGTVEFFAKTQTGTDIGLLHQEPDFAKTASITAVLEGSVAHLRAAEAAVHSTAAALAEEPDSRQLLDRYTAAVDHAEQLDVWETDARIEETVDGLGLAEIARHRTLEELSGGQRARLAMASLLLSGPEVLLLDEPTNHLDDAAIRYLSTVIAAWRGPVVIVSHDRAFLDDTVVSILDLDPAPRRRALYDSADESTTTSVTRFSGSYSDYLEAREAARKRWQYQYEEEQAQLRRLRAGVEDNQVVGHEHWKPRTETRAAQKFYADRNAKAVARRVNDVRARLTHLEQRQVVQPPRELAFQGLSAARTTPTRAIRNDPVITVDEVALDGRVAPISLTISASQKLLITGPNGAGKSTLLHLLAGNLEPSSGTMQYSDNVRIGFLTQESSFNNVADYTAEAVYQRAVGIETAEHVPLATFGLLTPRDEHRKLADLSTGQQRRLALAVVLADPPDVLLLDEPTNHLSLVLATELEASIEHYPGAVVIASHDRWLRRRWNGTHVQLG